MVVVWEVAEGHLDLAAERTRKVVLRVCAIVRMYEHTIAGPKFLKAARARLVCKVSAPTPLADCV